jgi:hypothetical protein
MRVPKAQRASIMVSLNRWRRARARLIAQLEEHDGGKEANEEEQRLSDADDRAEQALLKKLDKLPFGVINNDSDDILSMLLAWAAVGGIMNFGYDNNSFMNWEEAVADNLLEEEGDGENKG